MLSRRSLLVGLAVMSVLTEDTSAAIIKHFRGRSLEWLTAKQLSERYGVKILPA
jgi:hypothetical protein